MKVRLGGRQGARSMAGRPFSRQQVHLVDCMQPCLLGYAPELTFPQTLADNEPDLIEKHVIKYPTVRGP